MPKIKYKDINFRSKSLELIDLVNQVVEELQMLVDNYGRAINYLESEE